MPPLHHALALNAAHITVCLPGLADGCVCMVCVQVHVLNGEKYKEVCPDNTLLSSSQLRGCIIVPQPKRPLLKRESALGVMSEDVRTFLPIEVCCLVWVYVSVEGGG
jgi:hypothetical protein